VKLLFCLRCQDVIKLDTNLRKCKCGFSSGKYLEDKLHAEVSKDVIVLGLNNNKFGNALRNYFMNSLAGRTLPTEFDAWIINIDSKRIKWKG
jgi:hypothetical protein